MLEDMNSNSHGVYSEILVEKDFLQTTTKTPFVVVHFYHKDFKRCAIIDKHLAVSTFSLSTSCGELSELSLSPCVFIYFYFYV